MAYLHGFGKHLPARVVPNAELAPLLGRTPEWMEKASGIRERRWVEPDVTVADLAVAAAGDCLARTGIAAANVGLLIVASGSAAQGFPGPSAEIAQRLGLGTAPAIDLPMASAGSVFGIALAESLAETYGNILVIGAEVFSPILQAAPWDANTGMIFGDGAGASLISARPGPWRILKSVLHTDGQFRDDLRYRPGSPIEMNGLSIILQATRKLPSVIQEALELSDLKAADLEVVLLHQANLNLLTRVGTALGVAPEKIFSNVQRYGNTSSASVLIAAAEWSEGRMEDSSGAGPLVLAAFGAGLHWGAVTLASAQPGG